MHRLFLSVPSTIKTHKLANILLPTAVPSQPIPLFSMNIGWGLPSHRTPPHPIAHPKALIVSLGSSTGEMYHPIYQIFTIPRLL